MIRVIEKHNHCQGPVVDSLTLPYALRQKGRFRVSSDNGQDVGVFLPRGDLLSEGEYLLTECGKWLAVKAEAEAVVTAKTDCWLTFAKACYHLGNRHVPLQVGEQWLRFQPDHVLEEMVELLGLTVEPGKASFTPENGAYSHAGHSHGEHHSHEDKHAHHGHSHEHSHEHTRDHAHHHEPGHTH
ncbi:urease accessory protein UreE [Corallincola platygyrae]|uniref:Urease accessory protein UreE n=1 Tax=Corallincola platygyrae TaxID=1193278 RepID=A0ABW4XJ06_9GAMM